MAFLLCGTQSREPSMETNEKYEWLRIPAASAYLGVSARQLRRWVQARHIGYTKMGRDLVFSRAQLDEFVASSAVQARTADAS